MRGIEEEDGEPGRLGLVEGDGRLRTCRLPGLAPDAEAHVLLLGTPAEVAGDPERTARVDSWMRAEELDDLRPPSLAAPGAVAEHVLDSTAAPLAGAHRRLLSYPAYIPLASVRGVRIELLYWEGCPSYPEAKAILEEVLARRGIDAPVVMREVRTDEEAEVLRFPGSPTIRVDGRDVDPDGADGRPALNCRIYHLPDGRVSPVPTREQLEAAVS
jgi:hypothetical protein